MSRFGFIHDKLDIKILILYILQRLPDGVPLDILADLVLCDDGISYFDFAESVSELCATGHLVCSDECYFLTDKGRRNGRITESGIPYSIRRKADKSSLETANTMRRRGLIKTSSSENADGGINVELSLSDGKSDIIELKILAGSEAQAAEMKKAFRKNAEHIYNDIVSVIIGK